jgi:hypothetical protein
MNPDPACPETRADGAKDGRNGRRVSNSSLTQTAMLLLAQARFTVGVRRVSTAVVPARGTHKAAAPPPVRLRRRLECTLRRRGVAAAKKGQSRVAEPIDYDEDEDEDEDDDDDLDLVWGSEDDEGDEESEGDEEIFNFETGWNLKALGVEEDDDDDVSVLVRA